MTAEEARPYMVQAIDVMRTSVPEPRVDGKASPKVGAVLVEPPGSRGMRRTITACRGELRDGDHAEYTLLERKNRDRRVEDCVLFATLEPCAPSSRRHPKLGCAERIVHARIKEVWIGVEDPDPTVDRKGIKYLQDHGVVVNMFDQDLQQIILDENREFLEQALERASAASEEVANEVTLSQLESSQSGFELNDLSEAALVAYRDRAGIESGVGSREFRMRLERQGLVSVTADGTVPTGFGALLFALEPRVSMPQAGLLATVHYPDGTEEVRDFDGPMVMIPEEVMTWLRDRLPNVLDRSMAVRSESQRVPFELIREGVVNALVHRDYSIQGAKCQLIVTPDTVEIRSPGLPVSPISLDQLQSLQAPMLSRNPVLHYVFSRMKLAEERGLGLKSMRQSARQAGLPLPQYSWQDPYLVLRIFMTTSGPVAVLPRAIADRLSDAERQGWQWLATVGTTRSGEYAKTLGIDVRTARRHLSRFKELGLVKLSGSGPMLRYDVSAVEAQDSPNVPEQPVNARS